MLVVQFLFSHMLQKTNLKMRKGRKKKEFVGSFLELGWLGWAGQPESPRLGGMKRCCGWRGERERQVGVCYSPPFGCRAFSQTSPHPQLCRTQASTHLPERGCEVPPAAGSSHAERDCLCSLRGLPCPPSPLILNLDTGLVLLLPL